MRLPFAILLLSLLALISAAPTPAADPGCGLCTRGFFPCARCDGKGVRETRCQRCESLGTIRCPFCGGGGTWDCRCAGGQVRWDTGDKDACKVCHSTGSVKCGGCGGS